MKLIVDTNCLISALIRDSTARHIITHLDAELITITVLEKEVNKYKKLIIKKANISETDLNILLSNLSKKLIFLDDLLVISKMKEAIKIMDKIDPNDAPFIAAALATKTDIWSDDKHFEKQNKIKVWKTKDLVNFL